MLDLIVCEPEDINLRTFGNYSGPNLKTLDVHKKFNAQEYINKCNTTPEAVALRLAEVGTLNKYYDSPRFKNDFNYAINTAISTLKANNKMKISYDVERVFKKVLNGKANTISQTDKMCLNAASMVNKLLYQGGSLEEKNTNMCLNAIASMERDYKSRWFLKRWFGNESIHLGASIDDLKAQMKKTIGEKEFNAKYTQAFKGDLEDIPYEPKMNNRIEEIKKIEIDNTLIEGNKELSNDLEYSNEIDAEIQKNETLEEI